jgi:DNA repair protein RadC
MKKSSSAPGDPAAPSTKAKTSTAKRATSKRANAAPQTDEARLRAAVAPYLSVRRLQHLMAYKTEDLHDALLTEHPPLEIQAMLKLLSVLLRPLPPEEVTRPADVAGLLMVEMSGLAQEQVRVVCLDTKHRVQTIHTVYQGNVHTTGVRIGELFREALLRNSVGIILVHNHPSGDITPSPADLSITRDATAAGRLLGIRVLDHVIIGQGRWLSLGGEYLIFEG